MRMHDVIKPALSEVEGTADWVLDLGPGGGVKGGEIVAEGTPEQVAAEERSFTGAYLRPLLERGAATPTPLVPSDVEERSRERGEGSEPKRTRRRKVAEAAE